MKFAFIGKNTALILLWSVFVVRGFFYSAILPIWEGYDEPYYFASIQYSMASGTPPSPKTRISREVSASLHVLPLPWMLRLHGIPAPFYTHDDFWKLSVGRQAELRKALYEIPREWAKEPSPDPLVNYEAQQPPLYYLLFSIPLRIMQNRSLESRVLLLRLSGIILASFVVPIGYAVVKRITGQSAMAFTVVGLATIMPELFIDIARVANETAAFIIYTVLLYLATRVVEEPGQLLKLPVMGCLVGLGLLTKAYFLTALPALMAIALWCYSTWPRRRRHLLFFLTLALVSVLAIAGPWYWHVYRAIGSWSGLAREGTTHKSRLGVLAQIPHVNWIGGIKSIVLSHIWFGAWSFLRVPEIWYVIFGSVFFLATLGFLICVYRCFRKKNDSRRSLSEGYLVVLVGFYGFFWLGLGYDILLTYVSVGGSSSTGWYMYCLVIPELLLLYYGLLAILPRRAHPWIVPTLTTAFFLLDGYGLYFLLIPYYTGLIVHPGAIGQVNPVGVSDLLHFGAGKIVQRLLINKPVWMPPGVLYVLWFLTVVGSTWVVIHAWKSGLLEKT
jgi:4-amino-4-deoxy-L-arabinose transferase-like glycosyltransferase